MKLKKSRFNIVIDQLPDDCQLIYNSFSGIFGIMDAESRSVFEDIENFTPDGKSDDVMENVSVMRHAGYIVDTNLDELTAIKLERNQHRMNSPHLSLTIAPTMDCNMNCPYCYENKSTIAMSDEVQQLLLDFVQVHFKSNPDIKSLHVTWYGGEPLMQKGVIHSLSAKLIEICETNDKAYSAGIITNGALLDVETAKQLVENCKISHAQVTVDGMRDTHNARRILASGEDSFTIVTRNIDACKDILPINVRVNVDKNNADEVDVLTKYFVDDMGWKGNPQFYVSPVEIQEGDSCSLDSSVCFQGEEFADISLKTIRASYVTNRDAVVRSFFPSRKTLFCSGEGANSYVIDPEGNYYNCYRYIGMAEHVTGHISKPFLITEKYGEWLLADIKDKCEKCEYLPMCMGGCAIYRLEGDKEPKCFFASFTYKGVLKLAYEDYVARQITTRTAISTTKCAG